MWPEAACGETTKAPLYNIPVPKPASTKRVENTFLVARYPPHPIADHLYHTLPPNSALKSVSRLEMFKHHNKDGDDSGGGGGVELCRQSVTLYTS